MPAKIKEFCQCGLSLAVPTQNGNWKCRNCILIKKNICSECGYNLPDPVIEQREGGRSESVTECSCGAVYTS